MCVCIRSTRLGQARGLVLLVLTPMLPLSLPLPKLHAQSYVAQAGVETATEDRLRDPGWWPTKGAAKREEFTGAQGCAECHQEESNPQPKTPMGRAAQPGPEIALLDRHALLTFLNAPHTFTIARTSTGSAYSISDGRQILSRPLLWAFGAGMLGQTYLYQEQDDWYESQVSFYPSPQALDLTPGHAFHPDATLPDELGKRLTADDVQRCFQCHTSFSTTDGRFNPKEALGGLQCEMCHGPGRAHALRMKSSVGSAAIQSAGDSGLMLTDLGQLSPVDSVDFCGACHRTWADIAFAPDAPRGNDILRFQPYRLEKSRCWGTNGDQRITCVACHNPHKPLERNDAAYDRQCLACHRVKTQAASVGEHLPGRACPTSTKDCTSCHMPKLNVASMHGEFTDHWIRIVQPQAPLPR